ncbi:MAG: FKBP-type peptidyl-prolyl cis-trans isomerase, partial [Clostridium sp.]|nr:FKBP-type peptidyl-prolyl cis-trans isomerase [Clostridium sp.]
VVAGASGDADAAVEAYLRGELVNTGANCDHHDHPHEEEEGCGGCGEHEGGCGGCHGCGSSEPPIEGKNVGKTCRVHYKGTFNDGTQFDSSYDRGEPLEFICGAGMMIRGFDQAVANMEPGQIVDVHLMPEEAYGPSNPNAIFSVNIIEIPGAENLTVGQKVFLNNGMRSFPVQVTAKDETTITFDANHEMAGKELNFKIELVELL